MRRRFEAHGGAAPARPSAVYTLEEVAEHNSYEQRVWVTHKEGVFDITEFAKVHPGGEANILMAAGSDVGPHFRYWAKHLNSAKVRTALAACRIGTLDEASRAERDADEADEDDPYAGDPARDLLTVPPSNVLRRPYTGEPERLRHAFLTPNDAFFVRNHAPVPLIDPATHRIQICDELAGDLAGEGSAAHSPAGAEGSARRQAAAGSVSMQDLAQLAAAAGADRSTVVASFQCSASRLDEMLAASAALGPNNFGSLSAGSKNWIGNAQWEGAPLLLVLQAAGVDTDRASRLDAHLEFEGADGFKLSVPARVALDPRRRAVLATRMNGEALPPDHGFPVRALVPGFAGARNVKWLSRVSVRATPSDSPWQQHYYNCAPASPGAPLQPGEGAVGPAAGAGGDGGAPRAARGRAPAYEWPINCITTTINDGDEIRLGAARAGTSGGSGAGAGRAAGLACSSLRSVAVGGCAYCGGGRGVATVEVSVDGGVTWTLARTGGRECELEPEAGPRAGGEVEGAGAGVGAAGGAAGGAAEGASTPASAPTQHSAADADGLAWVLWQATVPVCVGEELVVTCRATDGTGRGQPATGAEAYGDGSGYFWNPYHTVRASVVA
jgi:sulfite oxidase